MEWVDLKRNSKGGFGRGCVFRTKAAFPYEKSVDFMLIEDPDSPSGFTFIVASGQKAGHTLIKLPLEARDQDPNTLGISAEWLQKNWNKWVYESDVSQVTFVRHYIQTI